MRKIKTKVIAFFLSVLFVLSSYPALNTLAATIATGSCGDAMTWSLDSNGTLTINSSGNMCDFGYASYQWENYEDKIRSVVFTGNITSIGRNAFYRCTNLTDITIPDTVTMICDSAFSGCKSLTSIKIPNSVKDIGQGAFSGCTSLTSINIPYGVTMIEPGTFSNCTNLTSVTIPNSVTEICHNAFRHCESLKSITIPNSVTSIDAWAFWGCTSLTSISLPNNITSIGNGLFNSCSNLTSVSIPDSVTTIGDHSFFECTRLSSIIIPEGVTSIGWNAFYGCKRLKNITIPEGVTYIDEGAFSYCQGLRCVTLPTSLSSLDCSSFSDCDSLDTVYYAGTADQFNQIRVCDRGAESETDIGEIFGNASVIFEISPISINTQPQDYTGKVGNTAVFSVAAAGTNLKYQWQTYSDGTWKNSSMTGYNTATLSVPVVSSRNGYKFRCVVTDTYNQIKTSSAATLNVNDTSISITTQPKDYTGTVGSTATFKVAIRGTGLKYQWQTYSNGSWKNSSLPGYNTATLSVPVTASRNGYKFRCVITDSGNNILVTDYATLNVIVPLSIIIQPKDYTGAIGNTATFKVTAQGTGLKYQWQTYSNGAWKNSSLPGYNTATLSVPITTARNGYKFRCVVTDSSNKTVTSNAAILTVTTAAGLSITTQPKNYSGAVGSTASFKVVAQGTGLKYQWQTYSNGTWKNSSLSGYNTSTLSVPVTTARNGYKFRCVVTDSLNKTVTSNAVTLTVTTVAGLSITTQPKNYIGAVGSTATFKIVVQGTGLKYQWQTYSNGIWKNSSLPGYDTATLSVPATAARNGYIFRCVVTDSSGKQITSNAVTLKVV